MLFRLVQKTNLFSRKIEIHTNSIVIRTRIFGVNQRLKWPINEIQVKDGIAPPLWLRITSIAGMVASIALVIVGLNLLTSTGNLVDALYLLVTIPILYCVFDFVPLIRQRGFTLEFGNNSIFVFPELPHRSEVAGFKNLLNEKINDQKI